MDRRKILGIAAALAWACALVPGTAAAQQKTVKDQLAGAWTLLLIDGKSADGSQAPLFGPDPIGSLMFSPSGRFSVEFMRTINRPPFASGNRDTGTAEENKATVQGTLALFGSYTVDEATKAINLHIEGSTFPNQENARLKWQVTAVTDEVLTYNLRLAGTSIPGAGYTSIEIAWKKVK